MRFQALFKLVRCWRAPNMEYWCVQCATTSSQQLQASERTEYQCFFFRNKFTDFHLSWRK